MRKFLVISAAVLMAATAVDPALAQGRGRGNNPVYSNGYEDGYRDAYRDAYRTGYGDARANRRFDDTDYSYGYGYSNGPNNNFSNNNNNNNYGNNNFGNNNYGNDDRDARWRARYTRTYTYNDDSFYRECRQSVDPAGVIAGALIGGLLGNAVGRGGGKGPATVAGVVVGGALGATLTRNLDCEDRSYAYKTYYDGFNAGRPNAAYRWQNPSNGHYGDFRVRDYYNDPDGFRCANYSQQIFVNGRPQAASGRACQQPDGTWAIVS
jgi:surface antigen